VGGGTEDRVHALATVREGAKQVLYAAGDFSEMGGIEASRIARWDGSAWNGLEGGLGAITGSAARVLAVHDDGEGESLCVGGRFVSVGGAFASLVAKGRCQGHCFEDLTSDGTVDVQDLLDLLAHWGECEGFCPADVDGSGGVDVFDLLSLLARWGECPVVT